MSYQRDFARRLRIAIIGVGSHAYRNILPALQYLPVHLQAVCDLNAPLAEATATQFACRAYATTAALYEREKLEAVLLVAGPAQHPTLACEAFDRGLHVWTEKPVGFRASDVQEMIRHRKDRIAVAGFKKAFMPAARKAIETIVAPQYGALKSMLAVYPMDVPVDGAAVLETRQFTNWLGNGVHPLSLLLAAGEASGGRVTSVTTHRGVRGGGVCFLEFSNGVTATFHLASGPQPIESYAFFGASWHLEIDNCLKVTLQRGYPFEYGRTTSYCPEGDTHGALVWEPQNCLATLENKALFTQGIYDELKHFCDCCLNGTPPQTGSLEFAYRLMQVYEAGLLSEGAPVAIE
jgi:predicted dehydrogenase